MSKLKLITVRKTLKKEGRAFRNIGNKKYIFPTAKSTKREGSWSEIVPPLHQGG